MYNNTFLNKLNLPKDIKNLNSEELDTLCKEIRKKILKAVSENGGHLASNLGVVELTVAMHRIFNFPYDKLVWDVGHQCYTNKILTGRLDTINKIRTKNGISGFPKKNESPYDCFDVGHSSTSISAALGIAKANEYKKNNNKVIAVIGDGALTGGLAYEGLNNAGRLKNNIIVVLNDNKMSISNNVGSVAKYLAKVRTKPAYLKTKGGLETLLTHTPIVGENLLKTLNTSKSALKNALYESTLFEEMGFIYYGPINGHDINELEQVFKISKQSKKPVLIHVLTKKGKGYEFAEKKPNEFHGISNFNLKTGQSNSSKKDYSAVFGEIICNLAKEDEKICAITAAMKLGTGLTDFANKFPSRFFDVGIAESHAVTFAGGMASNGMLPVFCVYSTFLQRAYDQLIHDVSLQNCNVTLAIDRAGVVGEDGETHQGLFDISFLNSIPNTTILCPSYYDEMEDCFKKAIYKYKGLSAVRYPRGTQLYRPEDYKYTGKSFSILGDTKNKIIIITYGRLFSHACIAKESLKKQGINISILKLNRILPIPIEAIISVLRYKQIFFYEEAMLYGGCAQNFLYMLNNEGYKGKYKAIAVDNKYVKQATMNETLHDLELDADGMEKEILRCLK